MNAQLRFILAITVAVVSARQLTVFGDISSIFDGTALENPGQGQGQGQGLGLGLGVYNGAIESPVFERPIQRASENGYANGLINAFSNINSANGGEGLSERFFEVRDIIDDTQSGIGFSSSQEISSDGPGSTSLQSGGNADTQFGNNFASFNVQGFNNVQSDTNATSKGVFNALGLTRDGYSTSQTNFCFGQNC